MNLKKIITNYAYVSFQNITKEKLILKLMQVNVSFYDVYTKDKSIIVKIKYEDLEKIKKYLVTLSPNVVEVTGLLYLQKLLKKYKLIIAGMLASFLLVMFASFIIVDVDVIHDDEDLVQLISEELEERGVKKFSFKKSFTTLEKIKKEIKSNNLDKIDWLEINKVGMKYVVRVEERIITQLEEEKPYCHIIATKDGLVTGTQMQKGELKVAINDYVKEGDILISGDIFLNEESVEKVCAKGDIYAEVWFNVSIDLPLEYYEKIKTGKKRKNIILNYDGVDRKIFKDRLEDYSSEKSLVFDLLGLKVYVQNDYEIQKIKKTYTIEEAEKKALEMAKEKVELKLQSGGEIISEKVLQKTVNDSTINIDIFIVAREQIGVQVEAKEEVIDDT